MQGLLSAWRNWQERRLILRDLKRQQADASERDRFIVKDNLTYALSALERGDQREATELWTKSLDRYPADTVASRLALPILIGLRRFDEAEALMHQGQKKYPRDARFAVGLGEISYARGDHKMASERWGALRKNFPGVMQGYIRGAESLRTLDRLDEAEDLAKKAMDQFHEEIGGFLEYARIAAHRQDWGEALRRWEPIRDRFGYVGAYVGAAQALTRLSRYDEAEEILEQARYRFGTNPSPLSELARVSEAKGDIPEAVQRWKSVLYRFPLDMLVYSSVSEAFERLHEPVEAETTLRAAIDRFPTESRPLFELAKLLQYQRRDFPAAAEAWAALRKTFPDNEEAYTSGADMLRHAGRPEDADALLEEHRNRFKSP
jgi:tetratricopeptide (TPR) repeat protein